MAAHEVFTQPWADAYREALNDNPTFKEAAASWAWPLAFVMDADAAQGVPDPRAVLFDLRHGTCHAATVVPEATAHKGAEFVISGPRHHWMSTLDGSIDPFRGLLFGRLRLRKGHIAGLLPYHRAAKAMVETAQAIPLMR